MLNLSLKNVKIVEKFKYFISVSIVFALIGIIFMIAFGGMNFGIDFTGGAKIEIEFSSFASDAEAQKEIDKTVLKFFEDNNCKTVDAVQVSPTNGGGVTYEYRLKYYHNGDLKTKQQEQDFIDFIQGSDVSEGLVDKLELELTNLAAENETLEKLGATIDEDSVKAYAVGATASGTLVSSAIWALCGAIVVMLIYIVIRFRLASALAAICALLHDVIIMIAFTAIFRIPVNSTFIAAVITIVGYSINATIVIFDRIRADSKLDSNKEKPLEEIANNAISATMMRSVLTTITTLVMVVLLAIMSVSSIRDFILPIIFGLFAGVYSSVFLASSFWVKFMKIGKKMKLKHNEKLRKKVLTTNNK